MRTLADGTVIAEGQVVVNGEGVTVRADSMRYDPGSDVMRLSGNVVMEESGGGGTFTGDTLALNLSDLTGGISRGQIIIVPNGFRVRGEDIKRTGPEEYSIRKGVFTSCPGDCPDWSFTASEILVRKEGYLEARHAAFRILDIPVFYTPYLLYPVKTDRQTGILFPDFRFSDETGFESSWPVFITLGPYADVTLTPRTFSRDANGLGLQARYRLDLGGGGDLSGFAMGGGDNDRWYIAGDHSSALMPDLWLRARWYDAGDPDAPSLFGQSFQERYPGSVFRHASLEWDPGPVGFTVQTSSLLPLAVLSRSGPSPDRRSAALDLGPVDLGPLRTGIGVRQVLFDEDGERTLLEPAASLVFTGPGRLGGVIHARALVSEEAEGTIEDRSLLFEMTQRLALEAAGEWGKSRIGFDLTLASARGASFSGTVARDAEDRIEKRRVMSGKVTHQLTSEGLNWDLTVGAWEDTELELGRTYGFTRFSASGFYFEASRNRDAEYGLILPSMDARTAAIRGWENRAGYDSPRFGVEVGRMSAEGFTETLKGGSHVMLGKVRVEGQAQYDLDTGIMAEESLTVQLPGRCWTIGLGRSRNPDRTDWRLKMSLEL
ncbi:MAG: putative LPS assembly protein LptD [bacterium]|nr:putative LPS assembly protein LptD [bacterium]